MNVQYTTPSVFNVINETFNGLCTFFNSLYENKMRKIFAKEVKF